MVGVRDLSKEDDEDDDEYDRYPEHPLFPLGEREKSVDISFIQVTRLEKGQQKWGPVFPAAELQTEQAILEMFGGGQYILVGRKPDRRNEAQPGRWVKKRSLTLPGKPRPLSSDPAPEEVGATDVNANGNGNSQPPNMGGMGEGFMALVTMMMKLSSDSNQQTMNMFMTMMNQAKEDSRRTTEVMMNMMQSTQTSTTGLITAILSNRGGGPEEMKQYAELLKSLGVGGGAAAEKKDDGRSDSIGGMLENAADIVQGMLALKGGGPPAMMPAEGVASPSVPPAPPGSAAALIQRMRNGG